MVKQTNFMDALHTLLRLFYGFRNEVREVKWLLGHLVSAIGGVLRKPEGPSQPQVNSSFPIIRTKARTPLRRDLVAVLLCTGALEHPFESGSIPLRCGPDCDQS